MDKKQAAISALLVATMASIAGLLDSVVPLIPALLGDGKRTIAGFAVLVIGLVTTLMRSWLSKKQPPPLPASDDLK